MKQAWALASIESLILGDFSENYSENDSDPLKYVFSKDKTQNQEKEYKRELALYRGFYEDGKNTSNYCKAYRKINYATEWKKVQVMRSMLSEIQYIGLDISARALPQYAKALEFTREDYSNLVEGLVGNYCSSNLSIISKKELQKNLMVKFDKENNFKLPSVKGNPYFPGELETKFSQKMALEQEFKFTVKLFQSICSWGGDPNNPGLMVPILKNSSLMAFFIRQMDNRGIGWKELNNTVFLKEDKNTVQVWCDNLICRKTIRDNFYQKIYYSIGGTSVGEDLRRLYCEEFKNAEYKIDGNDERLVKIMNTRVTEEEYFINSQFIALLTGVPDFLLRLEKFNNGEDILRSNIDDTWNKWAHTQTDIQSRELYFEEPLTLELVERNLYFDETKAKIKVAFDVNLGEFDRINQRTGKVRVVFKILLQRSFLRYYRQALIDLDPRNTKEKDFLSKRFKMLLKRDVALAKEKFIIPPWKGDLEGLIADELTEQLLLITDSNLSKIPNEGFEEVEVEINYGLFALKYINHQKTVQSARSSHGLEKNKSEE